MEFKLWLENREDQYKAAMSALMALHYSGTNINSASNEEILSSLNKLGKMPNHISPVIFIAQIKHVAQGLDRKDYGFNPQQDLAANRD